MAISQIIQNSVATGVAGTGPAFSAYQGTGGSQSISATTYTKVTFDVEVFDTNNNFASNRFTPTVAGYYQVNWLVTTQSTSPSNYLFTDLYKNGADFCRGSLTIPQTSSYGFSNGSALIYMNGTTDYLEVYCWSAASTSLANNQQYTTFNGSLVRAA